MFTVSSLLVLKRYMHCEFCVSMDYVTAHYTIFRAVVAAKLLYASSAWWGFTNASQTAKRLLHLFTAVTALFFMLQIWQTLFYEFFYLS